jgi:co-chaperonin GroES (HSP10)
MSAKYDLNAAAKIYGFNTFEFMPLLHRIIIEVPPKPKSTIILMDETIQRETISEHIGKVCKVGDIAFENFGTNVKPTVGDWVFFVGHAGQIFYKGESMYRLMNDEDVLAVLSGE